MAVQNPVPREVECVHAAVDGAHKARAARLIHRRSAQHEVARRELPDQPAFRHTIIPETLAKKIIRSDLFKFSCSLTEDHSDASDHSTKVAEYMNTSLAVGWRKRWCDLRSGFGGADGVVDGAKDNHRLGFDGADLLP